MGNKIDLLLVRALGIDGNCLPQGLLSIQSYLNKHGYNVKIFDRYVERDIRKLKKKLKGIKVVGISAMSIQSADAIYLAYMIRKWFGSKIKIIMGGVHFTVLPETARNYADHVVVGEGEIAMKNFLEAGNNHNDFIIPSSTIRNLDDIPSSQTEQMRKLVRARKFFHIITARGCPYRCNFCLGDNQRPAGLRFHSVDYVIDYMGKIIKGLGITSFNIVDDIFIISPKRVYEFCDKVEKLQHKLKKKISMECFTHGGHGNYALYKRMKEAGFSKVSMGVEHGNDNLLEYCGKGTTKAKIEQTCKDIYKAGIQMNLTYILGNLIETSKTITETVDFGIYLHKKYGASSWFSFMQPIPGSAACDEAEKHGRFLDKSVSNFSLSTPMYLPNGVTLQHLVNEQKRGLKYANSKNKNTIFSLRGVVRKTCYLAKKYHPKSIHSELKRVKALVKVSNTKSEILKMKPN